MRKKIAVSILFVLVGTTLGLAQEAKLEFEGRYWLTNLDADVKVVESGIGEKFDFKNDLGINDENLPEARIIWHTGPNSKLRLAYTQVNYSGDQSIARTVEFKGQSYTAGTRVESDLDIQYLRCGWIWQFVNLADDRIKVGSIIEAKGLMAGVSLKAPTLSLSDSEEILGFLPSAGIVLDIQPIKKINLFAEVSGIGAGELGYFFDAEAGIKILAWDNFSIAGGYRLIDIKAENDPDFAKVEIGGPFVSATVKF
ncbi:MAG: hypothetical protein AB1629_05520 [Candidatus Omnitrophota bacterium]